MCYVSEFSLAKKPRIAKRNIKVFKFGLRRFDKVIPYYYREYSGMNYREGIEYNSEIRSKDIGFKIYIDKGLHSFNSKLCWSKKIKGYLKVCSILMSPDMEFANNAELVKIKCHIPKGSTYYINYLTGEMVSDRIVVDKIKRIK